MLLTLTTTHSPATDIGYLLRKNPARPQSFSLSFGKAHVFYPEATPERCTVALLVEVDPVGLVRNRRGPSGEGGALEQYVNDRPYAASSFLSVAIAEVFGSALAGKSKERPELVETPLPLRVTLSALPCRGGEEFLRKLFEPLGYSVSTSRLPLDERFPDWGGSAYHRVELEARLPLQKLLSHLYVLVPVLDADKHYWVGDDEVEKLLQKGEGWLATHPEKESITARYLRFDRKLTRAALARLTDEETSDPEAVESSHLKEELQVEGPLKLWEQRIGSVMSALRAVEAKTVVDLGCGEGRLLKELLQERSLERIVGMDVSWRSLEMAHRRLYLDQMAPAQRKRIELIHGSLMYRDKRLSGFDAATVIEVIEHLDPPRLAAFERVVFEHA